MTDQLVADVGFHPRADLSIDQRLAPRAIRDEIERRIRRLLGEQEAPTHA